MIPVGVNLRPFCNNFISISFNLRLDKLTIWMSVDCFAIGCCMMFCSGTKNIIVEARVVWSILIWVWVALELMGI